MSNYKAVIIDDEKNSASSLEMMINSTGYLEVIGIFYKPEQAIIEIPLLRPDIIFLDIQMPKINGIETAELLQKLLPCKFIFTTGYKNYALASFQFNTIDYLIKPILFPRLLQAISKVFNSFESESTQSIQRKYKPSFILVDTVGKGAATKIQLYEIELIGTDKNYLDIFLYTGECIKTRMTTKVIESLIPAEHFIRVHRKYIVRLDAISLLISDQITLKQTRKVIPVGRAYRNAVKEAYNKIVI
jgi:two-component system, LytTR family, response regulator